MTKTNNEDKTRLIEQIKEKICEAEKHKKTNENWNKAFLIGLMLSGAAIVICSAIVSYNPSWRFFSFMSTILGGLSTVLSGFAFNRMNFEARLRIWSDIGATAKTLRDEIDIAGKKEEDVLYAFLLVRSWGDYNSPPQAAVQDILTGRKSLPASNSVKDGV